MAPCCVTQGNKDKSTGHLEDRHNAIVAAVALNIERQYDTRVHKDLAGAATFISTAIATYCTQVGHVKEFLMKVIVCNLNYIGSRWGSILGPVIEYLSLQINENPECTVGIVICPLFPARAEMDDQDSIVGQVHFVE